MERALCQVCGDGIDEDRVYCSSCHAPHHPDCWKFNGGCSIFACGGKHSSRSDRRFAPTGEVVVIDDATPEPPAPPPVTSPNPFESPSSRRSLLLSALLAVTAIRAFETFTAPAPPPPPPRPQHAHARKSVRPWRPTAMRLTRSIAGAPGATVLTSGTMVIAYESDTLGRRRIVLPTGKNHWVPSSDLTLWRPPGVFTSRTVGVPAGVAQLVRDLPGVPKGELIFVRRQAPTHTQLLGIDLQFVQCEGVRENGALVKVHRSDIEIVRAWNPATSGPNGQTALREARLDPAVFRPGGDVILVESTAGPDALIPAGTVVRVQEIVSRGEDPTWVTGTTDTGVVRVPAAVCRPILARALRSPPR